MGRGARPESDAPAPRRPSDTIRAARAITGRWSELLAYDEAIIFIPERDPTKGHPDRISLRAWRATRIAGGWEPVEELSDGVRHISSPWLIEWP